MGLILSTTRISQNNINIEIKRLPNEIRQIICQYAIDIDSEIRACLLLSLDYEAWDLADLFDRDITVAKYHNWRTWAEMNYADTHHHYQELKCAIIDLL